VEGLLRKAPMERNAGFRQLRVVSEALMELEVTEYVGAERHQRMPERTGQCKGYRERGRIPASARSNCGCCRWLYEACAPRPRAVRTSAQRRQDALLDERVEMSLYSRRQCATAHE
jgi:hypothetical protein